MATTLRKHIVKNAFEAYLPQQSDFEIVEEKIPALKAGEFLVKAEYISVDPYMRSFASGHQVPYAQFGFQVGTVIGSKNKEYPVDTYVVSHSGWSDFVILDGNPDEMFGLRPYRPIDSMRPLLAVGALGMPGMTAYLGLLEVCKPIKKDVVCVTSAAGAVGSLVGQIAKLKDCTVIGLAGTDQKVQILKQELGFHHAFNYKTEPNIKVKLKSIAPKGINCFFDNVGGDLSKAILECMSDDGRVAVCGAISTYGEQNKRSKRAKTSVNLKIEEFSFTQWNWTQQLAALNQLKCWIENGSITVKETIADGFEGLPAALIAMLKGENIGKAVVKI